jgi:hypothetical protein
VTFAELLLRTDRPLDGRVLDGTPQQTFDRLRAGRHRDPGLQRILRMVIDWCALAKVDESVERAALVNALGPLRLELMQSGEDLETYAVLNTFIAAVDAAFDEAVLDAGAQSGRRH